MLLCILYMFMFLLPFQKEEEDKNRENPKSTTIEGNPQLKSYLIRSTIFFKCHVAFCWESLALWGNFHIRNLETSYKIVYYSFITVSISMHYVYLYCDRDQTIASLKHGSLCDILYTSRYFIHNKNVISSDPVKFFIYHIQFNL